MNRDLGIRSMLANALDEYDAYQGHDGFDAFVLTVTDYFSNKSEAQTGAIQGKDD